MYKTINFAQISQREDECSSKAKTLPKITIKRQANISKLQLKMEVENQEQ